MLSINSWTNKSSEYVFILLETLIKVNEYF